MTSQLADWENSKENIQPLKQGRIGAKLTDAFKEGTIPSKRDEELNKQKQQWEMQIQSSEAEDPLEVWKNYLCWTEQSYPTAGMKSEYLTLLERCTREFSDSPKYSNDIRYITIWLKYANQCADPTDIFAFMKNKGIGEDVALFYIGWSIVLENKQEYLPAEKVLDSGLRRLAQPIQQLKKHYKDFQRRMADRLYRQKMQEMTSGGASVSENDENRPALQSLTKKQAASSIRKGAAPVTQPRAPQPRSSGNKSSGFAIFEDDANAPVSDEPVKATSWTKLAGEKERHKENTSAPTTWNKPLKTYKKVPEAAPASTTPGFEVFVDEDFQREQELKHQSASSSESALSVRSQLDGTSSIRNDPLRNYSAQPHSIGNSKPPMQPRAKQQQPKISNVSTDADYSRVGPEETPKLKLAYDKTLLLVDGEEFCFEEVRAARFAYFEVDPMMDNNAPVNHEEEDMMMTTIVNGKIKAGPEGKTLDIKKLLQEQQPATVPTPASAPVPAPAPEVTPVKLALQERKPLQPQPAPVAQPVTPVHAPSTPSAPLQPFMKTVPAATAIAANTTPTAPSSSFLSFQPRVPTTPTMTINTRMLVAEVDAMFESTLDITHKQKQTQFQEPTMTINTKQLMAEVDSMFGTPITTPSYAKKGQQQRDSLSLTPTPIKPFGQVPAAPASTFEIFDDNSAPASSMSSVQQHDDFEIYDENKENDGSSGVAGRTFNDDVAQSRALQPMSADAVPQPKKLTFGDVIKQELGGASSTNRSGRLTNGDILKSNLMNVDDEELLADENNNIISNNNNGQSEFVIYEDTTANLTNANPPVPQPASAFEFDIYQDPDLVSPKRHKSDPQSSSRSSGSLLDVSPLRTDSSMSSFSLSPGATPSTMSYRSASSTATISSLSTNTTRSSLSTSFCSFPSPSGSILSPANGRSAKSRSRLRPVMEEPTGPSEHVPATSQESEQQQQFTVNPFSQAEVNQFLVTLSPPLTTYPRFYDFSKKIAPSTTALNQVIKNGGKKDASDFLVLELDGCGLEVDACIGCGAFAHVFLVNNVDTFDLNNCTFALKVQSPPCSWEFYISHQIQKRIVADMKAKYCAIYSEHLYQDKSFILMDYSEAGTLQDAINAYKQKGSKMDEILAIYFTIEMLNIIEQLHKTRIIHGDVKPDNFLLLFEGSAEEWQHWQPGTGGGWGTKGLRLIDFGRSIDTSLYPEGTMFHGDCHADSFRCIEMQTEKPWTFQVDIFGIVAVAHCLLHGTYMETVLDSKTNRWRAKEPFKRYHQEMWQELFDAFLNINDCNSLPDLSYFRQKLEGYFIANPHKAKAIKPELAKLNAAIFEMDKSYNTPKTNVIV